LFYKLFIPDTTAYQFHLKLNPFKLDAAVWVPYDTYSELATVEGSLWGVEDDHPVVVTHA
jgi:hypothetical protein